MRRTMECSGGSCWSTALSLDTDALCWRYAVVQGDEVMRREEQGWRRMPLDGSATEVVICDAWGEVPMAEEPYRHSAFSENIFAPRIACPSQQTCVEGQLMLVVGSIPPGGSGRLYATGSTESLGKWDTAKAVGLQRIDTYLWGVNLPLWECLFGIEYKFLLLDETGTPTWEEGGNRSWHPATPSPPWRSQTVVWGGRLRMNPPQPRWAGIAVPLFSLRSSYSWGVGDFRDLKDLGTWASAVGMRFVQILPINDTTSDGGWADSYPYSARSVFALHPIYLDPTPWGELPFYEDFARRGAALEHGRELDYVDALRLKMEFLDKLYASEGRGIVGRKAFRDFLTENDYWLTPYTRCRAAASLYGKRRSARFYAFVQFILHRQLSAVHEHYRGLRVVLKGDIPIGVSPDSVSAQTHPELFHLDCSAGAPPDDFAADGQNWGFPTYNWQRMARDGYHWWRMRLGHLGRYFDAIRIDHVLGFFRIWEIPRTSVGATLGHFRPAMPYAADELRCYGFTLPPAFFTKPHLSDTMLSELGIQPQVARHIYFNVEGGYYTLKPQFQTERQICSLDIDEKLRQTLLRCVHEVLFLEDLETDGRYHPRINASNTLTYRQLPPDQRRAFDALHEDFFYHRHEEMWAAGAQEKFDGLFRDRSPSDVGPLPCAEDLGMVPGCVPSLLRSNGMLSLEVRRMPKAPGMQLSCLSENPYLSVDTISTHDMPPLRLWWRGAVSQRAELWKQMHPSTQPPAELSPADAASIVQDHLNSPSMLCILALQDWMAVSPDLASPDPESEQINQPSDPHHRWRYRMHITLEELQSATPFREMIRTMISRSGRDG